MADSLFALNGGGRELPFLIPSLDIGDRFFNDPDHRYGRGRAAGSAGTSIPGMPKMDARASDTRFWENRYNAALGRVAEMIPRYPSMEYALKSPDVIKTLNEAIPSVSEQVSMSNMKKEAEAYSEKIRTLEAGEEADVRTFENDLSSGNISGNSFRTLGQSAQHHFDVESMYGPNAQQKQGFYTYDQPIGTLQQTREGITKYFDNLGKMSYSGGEYTRDKQGNLVRVPTGPGGSSALQKFSASGSSNIYNMGFDPRDPAYDIDNEKYNPEAVIALGEKVMQTLSAQEIYGAKSGFIKQFYSNLSDSVSREITPDEKRKRFYEMTNALSEDQMYGYDQGLKEYIGGLVAQEGRARVSVDKSSSEELSNFQEGSGLGDVSDAAKYFGSIRAGLIKGNMTPTTEAEKTVTGTDAYLGQVETFGPNPFTENLIQPMVGKQIPSVPVRIIGGKYYPGAVFQDAKGEQGTIKEVSGIVVKRPLMTQKPGGNVEPVPVYDANGRIDYNYPTGQQALWAQGKMKVSLDMLMNNPSMNSVITSYAPEFIIADNFKQEIISKARTDYPELYNKYFRSTVAPGMGGMAPPASPGIANKENKIDLDVMSPDDKVKFMSVVDQMMTSGTSASTMQAIKKAKEGMIHSAQFEKPLTTSGWFSTSVNEPFVDVIQKDDDGDWLIPVEWQLDMSAMPFYSEGSSVNMQKYNAMEQQQRSSGTMQQLIPK